MFCKKCGYLKASIYDRIGFKTSLEIGEEARKTCESRQTHF